MTDKISSSGQPDTNPDTPDPDTKVSERETQRISKKEIEEMLRRRGVEPPAEPSSTPFDRIIMFLDGIIIEQENSRAEFAKFTKKVELHFECVEFNINQHTQRMNDISQRTHVFEKKSIVTKRLFQIILAILFFTGGTIESCYHNTINHHSR